jgi:hypothetical protein
MEGSVPDVRSDERDFVLCEPVPDSRSGWFDLLASLLGIL